MPRKFKILDRAPEWPHKCIISGLAGPVVDMEKFVEGYGRVYLHVGVVAGMAEKLGFLLDKDVAQLRDELAVARAEADRWPATLTMLEEDIHDLVVAAAARARGELPVPADGGAAAEGSAAAHVAEPAVDGAAGAGDGPAGLGEPAGFSALADLPFDQPPVLSE